MDLETFIEDLKSKQIHEYKLMELQEKIETIYYYHKATRSKKEKLILKDLYQRIVTYYNKKANFKAYKETL